MRSYLRNEYSYVSIASDGEILTLKRKWKSAHAIGAAILCFGLLHVYLLLTPSNSLAYSQLQTALLVITGLTLTLLRGVIAIDRKNNKVLTYWSSILNVGQQEYPLSDFKTITVQHVYQKYDKGRYKRFLYPIVLQGPKTIYLHIAISKETALQTAEKIANFLKMDIVDQSMNDPVEY